MSGNAGSGDHLGDSERPHGGSRPPAARSPAAGPSLAGLVENAPHPLAVTAGPDHVVRRINAAFAHLMHADASEVVGRPYAEAFPEPPGSGPLAILSGVYESGEPASEQEIERPRPDAEPAVWSYTVWPLRDASGPVEGLVVEVRDRTPHVHSVRHLEGMADQIRHINERLLGSALREQEWAEKAEAAAKAKSDFLAMMSHELRTPLSGIVGYTEVLTGGMLGPINERQMDAMQRIGTCSSHLMLLIEDILSFARVESQSLQVRPERVDLGELAREAAAVIQPLAAKKSLTLHVEVPVSPLTLETDPHKVRQILLNLLGNAVKFTERGEVRLLVHPDVDHVTLRVVDTGIGIPPEDLERVFEPFVQTEAVMTRRFGGTGLGLPISRALATMLGGHLSAESELGRGTTFSVRLPLTAPGAQEP